MFYYAQTDDKIKKYKVSYDKDKMEELRTELINNCSITLHREYKSTMLPYKIDYQKIRNYSYKKVGVKEYIDGPDKDIYLITYDELEYPKLVLLIERILKNDISALTELYIDENEIQKEFDKKINNLESEITTLTNNKEFNKIKNKIRDLEHAFYEVNENKNRRIYYNKVKSFLSFELQATISIDEINRVREFYGQELLEKKLIIS